MRTADLIDDHAAQLTLVHLPFRRFGKRTHLAGPVQTVKCFEDNSVVKAVLSQPGAGRILVVDGGGSTRTALVGDQVAGLAIQNDWGGLVINGVIRDSADINEKDILLFALGTSPVKSAKAFGEEAVPISIGGAVIAPGDWIYGDADGVLHSADKLI